MWKAKLFQRPAHCWRWILINFLDDCTMAHPCPSCSVRNKNLLLIFWIPFFHISVCQSIPFHLLTFYLVSQTFWSSAFSFLFFSFLFFSFLFFSFFFFSFFSFLFFFFLFFSFLILRDQLTAGISLWLICSFLCLKKYFFH